MPGVPAPIASGRRPPAERKILAKLQALKDAGTISAAEFEDLKKKLVA